MLLDLKDKRILWELDKDSRQPLSKIAKKVRLTKEAVYYRIKKLEERGVITGYTLLASLAALGLMHVKLLIKFQNVTSEKKKEIIDYLVKHQNSNWVVSCNGSHNLVVGFVVKNLKEFNAIKEDFNDQHGDFILKSNFSIMLEGYGHGRKYLLGKPTSEWRYVEAPQPVKLDTIDLRLLNLLSTNTRARTTELATKLKTTPRVVSYRIKNLEKQGVIQKYTISVNHEILGRSFFKSFIHLRKTAKKKEILAFCAQQESCVHNVEVLAEWSLEPEFEVSNPQEFYRIMQEIENRYGDQIKTIETILISKEHKYVLLPKVISDAHD